ncbi:tetratricopeptide repeat protein [Flavihumibacter profundi]|uniref:tetratricopeptide repeat protein n=1 Tax=Flavihumibacter profundi TaxID=2716883 RepID=UPI001CC710FE|nr:tetratricopeptide repeat protein [Flavihumibacter profundi]MBZ5859226.1 tetratricopeptide repeat protein [Flavihumibacter profundi]
MTKFLFGRTVCLCIGVLLISLPLASQTFTMGKDCKAQNAKGKEELKARNYQQAYETFTKMKSSCKTKDGKEASSVGLAEALNGLGKYEEAITASNEALKVTKNKSLAAYFQMGVAQNKLGQYDASKASLDKIIQLTEKNQDKKARASNYALMAAMYDRQLGKPDSAAYYLEKAIALDPANPGFYVQKGDMLVARKKFEEAFIQYDKGVSLGKTDLEMYIARSEARLKMMENKYHTTNAQELRAKMTASEKELVCTDLKKALDLGWKDMNKDMFAALVCK